jgi:hypothetical protein
LPNGNCGSRVLCLPQLVAGSDGALSEPFPQLGAVRCKPTRATPPPPYAACPPPARNSRCAAARAWRAHRAGASGSRDQSRATTPSRRAIRL